jgi:hypothetical protein
LAVDLLAQLRQMIWLAGDGMCFYWTVKAEPNLVAARYRRV